MRKYLHYGEVYSYSDLIRANITVFNTVQLEVVIPANNPKLQYLSEVGATVVDGKYILAVLDKTFHAIFDKDGHFVETTEGLLTGRYSEGIRSVPIPYYLMGLVDGRFTITDNNTLSVDDVYKKNILMTNSGLKLQNLIRRKTRLAYGIIARTPVDDTQENRYESKEIAANSTPSLLQLEADIRKISVDDLVVLINAKTTPYKQTKVRFDLLVEGFKTGVNLERTKETPDWDKVYNYLLLGENIGRDMETATPEVFGVMEQSVRDLFIQ